MTTRSHGENIIICAVPVTFIVLKVTGAVDWPWLWVLAPVWVSAIIGIIAWLIINYVVDCD